MACFIITCGLLGVKKFSLQLNETPQILSVFYLQYVHKDVDEVIIYN